MSIIIEGPDGAGKTTLLRRLMEEFDLTLHVKASDSTTGPVKGIWEWTERDADSIVLPHVVYDRHPVFSEPIYRTVLKDRPLDPRFSSPAGYSAKDRILRRSLVILCLPPFKVLKKTVLAEPQMAGVVDHLYPLWKAYESMQAHHRYDFTKPWALEPVLQKVEDHLNV